MTRRIIKLTIVVGLPGSGKTTLGKRLLNESPDDTLFIDDFSLNTDDANKFDVALHNRIIITDPYLCRIPHSWVTGEAQNYVAEMCLKFFPALRNGDVDWEAHFFENDLEACLKNIHRDPKPLDTIRFATDLASDYNPPTVGCLNEFIHPVYKEEENV